MVSSLFNHTRLFQSGEVRFLKSAEQYYIIIILIYLHKHFIILFWIDSFALYSAGCSTYWKLSAENQLQKRTFQIKTLTLGMKNKNLTYLAQKEGISAVSVNIGLAAEKKKFVHLKLQSFSWCDDHYALKPLYRVSRSVLIQPGVKSVLMKYFLIGAKRRSSLYFAFHYSFLRKFDHEEKLPSNAVAWWLFEMYN